MLVADICQLWRPGIPSFGELLLYPIITWSGCTANLSTLPSQYPRAQAITGLCCPGHMTGLDMILGPKSGQLESFPMILNLEFEWKGAIYFESKLELSKGYLLNHVEKGAFCNRREQSHLSQAKMHVGQKQSWCFWSAWASSRGRDLLSRDLRANQLPLLPKLLWVRFPSLPTQRILIHQSVTS